MTLEDLAEHVRTLAMAVRRLSFLARVHNRIDEDTLSEVRDQCDEIMAAIWDEIKDK